MMPAFSASQSSRPSMERAADPNADDAAPKKPRRLGRMLFAAICWFYLVLVVALWIFLRVAGDRWWVATLLLFGPLWVFALPLALLLPAAALFRRRSIWVLLLAGLILLFPVMDLCIPWKAVIASDRQRPVLRVLTCNIHYHLLDGGAMATLIADTHPDLVCLQEYTSAHQKALFGDSDWHILRDGEFCLASRYPVRVVGDVGASRRWVSAICYEVTTPMGVVHFFNVHLASPHPAFEAALHRSTKGANEMDINRDRRLHGAEDLSQFAQAVGGSIICAGDFNLPRQSAVYRENLRPYRDAFSEGGLGFGWTYHAKWTKTRIDHILSDDSWQCRRCWLGPDVGSPHRPLIAELEWVGAAK